jgi:protein-tyrosine phosphatase
MADDRFRILFVCTGNICRSPMAQAMLVHRLRGRVGDASALFEVSSAGTYGLVGEPMEPDALTALGELGVTADPFEARELVAELVDESDLVLAATREHRAAAVTLVPRASRKVFTIREFARLVAAVDLGALDSAGADAPARLRALVDAAASQRGIVRPDTPADDDVADPYRRPLDAFRAAARQLDEATSTLVDRIAAVVPG